MLLGHSGSTTSLIIFSIVGLLLPDVFVIGSPKGTHVHFVFDDLEVVDSVEDISLPEVEDFNNLFDIPE